MTHSGVPVRTPDAEEYTRTVSTSGFLSKCHIKRSSLHQKHFGFHLTVKELGALSVALLHFLTLVSSCLHVAVCGGENSCPALHQELTELRVVAGGSAVKGGPTETAVTGWLHFHTLTG